MAGKELKETSSFVKYWCKLFSIHGKGALLIGDLCEQNTLKQAILRKYWLAILTLKSQVTFQLIP